MLETTNDITFVTPIMITLMLSKWIGDLFNISLYDLHVELLCMPFVESKPSGNMFAMNAENVMAAPVQMVTARCTVAEVTRLLTSCKHNGFPVVTETAPNKFIGTILRNQLIVMLKKRAFGGKAMDKLRFDDFSTTLSSKAAPFDAAKDVLAADGGAILDLRPIMNPVPITVQRECPLSRVFTLFRSLGMRHLVVTDDTNEVVGIISRKEIMSSFDQDLF